MMPVLPSRRTARSTYLYSVLKNWGVVLALTLGASLPLAAQVNVSPSPASYTTLKGAFDAINIGTHTGAITISIAGNTTETVSAVLNASGMGAASYTSINISPTGGAARTISGSIRGRPLIDLDGADNVTIDGLNTGGNSLSIANTDVFEPVGTSTIRFINDASGNRLENTTINGSARSATTGTIFFSDTVGTTGNDNNVVNRCNIGRVDPSNSPAVGILSVGTTTSVATRNSGNQITNNNIFDFYNGDVGASGILATGSTDWTITGNSIFQTAPRNTPTGSGLIGVSIEDTVGVNFVVSDNFIGGSSASAGGSAWTQAGNSIQPFIGIRLSVGTTTPSSVQNNTIRNIAISSWKASTVMAAIAAVSGSINVGTVAGNTIGDTAATGSITWTGLGINSEFYGILAGTGSPGVIAISNNAIGGITIAASSSGGNFGETVFHGINTQGAATSYLVSGNTIGSTTIANSVSNSTNDLVVGIASSSSSPSVTISNNTIANLTTTSTSLGNPMAGMLISGGINTITGNTIRNFVSSSRSALSTSTQTFTGIVMSATSAGQIIAQNTIHSANNTAATSPVSLTGIYWGNGSNSAATNIVERNYVHSLGTTSSGAATINGIYARIGGATYRNNMIRLGIDQTGTSLTSAALTINGIQGQSVTFGSPINNWHFNSVYVGGSGVSGAGAASSSGFKRLDSDTMDFRNNIIVNNRSNGTGTGKHYAMNMNAITGVTSDRNNFHGIGTGAVFGVVAGADSATLAAWQIDTSLDGSSFFSDPAFLDPTGAAATVDLHINPSITTSIEGNGVPLASPVDDFDGQARAGLTPVDIGADAGNFIGVDLAPPVIAYTPLGNTTSLANRSLNSTIIDPISGVPTAGVGLPVIYFRKGTSGAYASTQASSGGAGGYTFTIDYALVSGGSVAPGDTIQYYVMAQDNKATPNVGSDPATGAIGLTANPPAAASAPITPRSYLIFLPVGGIKTVCAASCDYTTLTGAGGAFSAINAGLVIGNVDLQIAGDLTLGEDGSNALNALAEDPVGSNFNVRIYPTGSARVISGSTASRALIRMNGASRVTIDGSIGGAGTDRSLTITNNNVTSPSVVLFGSVSTTPITHLTLRNSIIINGFNTSTAVIISNAANSNTAGYFSNITIQNNDIRRAYIGVYAISGSTLQSGSNLVLTQNTINTSGADAVRYTGIYMQGVNGATVSQNTIGNFSNIEGERDAGIWLSTGSTNVAINDNTVTNLGMTSTGAFAPVGIYESSFLAVSGNTIAGNTITNLSTNGSTAVRGIAVSGGGVSIQGNRIQGIANNNVTTRGAFGIDVTAGNDDVIQNNFVSDVNHNMSGGGAFDLTDGVVGIRLGAGSGHKVYFNSVNLFGLHTGTAAATLLSAAFSISAVTQTGIDVRNNIFANKITGGTTSVAHVSVYLPAGGTSAMNLIWNNNAYYFGPGAARQGVGQAGTTPGTNFFTTRSALAAYTATLSPTAGNDNASIAANTAVPFVSNADLHISAAAAPANAGVPIAGSVVDIDGDPRSGVSPEIGADEIPNTVPSITPTAGSISRVRGSAASNSQIAVVSDAESAAGTLVVTAASVPAGITVSNIVNTAGTITADVAASCSATLGGNNVGLRVRDQDLLFADAAFTVNVSASPPTLGTYPAAVALPGGGTTVTPSAAPSDDGSIVSIFATAPAFTGNLSVNTTTGVVTVTTAGPAGVYTVTVTATDDCGEVSSRTFQLTVSSPNTAPTIDASASVSAKAGDAIAVVTIATVADAEDAENTLSVKVNGGATATSNGVTVSGIGVAPSGVVNANVVAACGATSTSFTLTVTDSGSLFATDTLAVQVMPNTAPTLSYGTTSLLLGAGTTANPATGPTDSGSIASVIVQSSGTFTGTSNANVNGNIVLANAGPLGTHTIIVRVTDNCSVTTDASLVVNVLGDAVFENGFEGANRIATKMQLLLGDVDQVQSVVLPKFDLLHVTNGKMLVDLIEFDIGGVRILLQVRDQHMRLLSRDGERGMTEDAWFDLVGSGTPSLTWVNRSTDGQLRVEAMLTTQD